MSLFVEWNNNECDDYGGGTITMVMVVAIT